MGKPLTRLGALTLIGLSVFLVARWKKRQEEFREELIDNYSQLTEEEEQ